MRSRTCYIIYENRPQVKTAVERIVTEGSTEGSSEGTRQGARQGARQGTRETPALRELRRSIGGRVHDSVGILVAVIPAL